MFAQFTEPAGQRGRDHRDRSCEGAGHGLGVPSLLSEPSCDRFGCGACACVLANHFQPRRVIGGGRDDVVFMLDPDNDHARLRDIFAIIGPRRIHPSHANHLAIAIVDELRQLPGPVFRTVGVGRVRQRRQGSFVDCQTALTRLRKPIDLV